MRHHVFGRHLNRDYQHRKALLQNLLKSLIKEGVITTSEAKAKAIQGQFDKLVTKAKKGTVHHRRQIHTVVQSTTLVNRLVDELAPLTKDRVSGFTRLTRIKFQTGNDQLLCRLEMIDYKKSVTPVEKTNKKEAKLKKAEAKKAKQAQLPAAPKALKSAGVTGAQKVNAPRKAIWAAATQP